MNLYRVSFIDGYGRMQFKYFPLAEEASAQAFAKRHNSEVQTIWVKLGRKK